MRAGRPSAGFAMRRPRSSGVLGVLYFIVILVIAVAAIPLLLLTNGGQG